MSPTALHKRLLPTFSNDSPPPPQAPTISLKKKLSLVEFQVYFKNRGFEQLTNHVLGSRLETERKKKGFVLRANASVCAEELLGRYMCNTTFVSLYSFVDRARKQQII